MNGFSLLLLDILLSQAFLALPDLISANPSQRAWTPTPAAPVVLTPVSSLRASAFPDLAAGRRSTLSWTASSVQGGLFGAAALSSCSGPPVCLPPRWLPPPRPFQASGSRGFYFWAPHSSLPPRGPDRLAVRIEQLTAGRLALPKIRSLVSCTARPDPSIPILCRDRNAARAWLGQ